MSDTKLAALLLAVACAEGLWILWLYSDRGRLKRALQLRSAPAAPEGPSK